MRLYKRPQEGVLTSTQRPSLRFPLQLARSLAFQSPRHLISNLHRHILTSILPFVLLLLLVHTLLMCMSTPAFRVQILHEPPVSSSVPSFGSRRPISSLFCQLSLNWSLTSCSSSFSHQPTFGWRLFVAPFTCNILIKQKKIPSHPQKHCSISDRNNDIVDSRRATNLSLKLTKNGRKKKYYTKRYLFNLGHKSQHS